MNAVQNTAKTVEKITNAMSILFSFFVLATKLWWNRQGNIKVIGIQEIPPSNEMNFDNLSSSQRATKQVKRTVAAL